MNEPQWLLRIDNYNVIWSSVAPTLLIECFSDTDTFDYIQLWHFQKLLVVSMHQCSVCVSASYIWSKLMAFVPWISKLTKYVAICLNEQGFLALGLIFMRSILKCAKSSCSFWHISFWLYSLVMLGLILWNLCRSVLNPHCFLHLLFW